MARRKKKQGMLVFLIGNVISSILGLLIGYYILVQIRPEMDFLDLNLPTIQDIRNGEMPDWWSKFQDKAPDPVEHPTPAATPPVTTPETISD